jgi:hypothetical protein
MNVPILSNLSGHSSLQTLSMNRSTSFMFGLSAGLLAHDCSRSVHSGSAITRGCSPNGSVAGASEVGDATLVGAPALARGMLLGNEVLGAGAAVAVVSEFSRSGASGRIGRSLLFTTAMAT